MTNPLKPVETGALKVTQEDEDRCDICCRPRDEHVGRDLQCDQTTYFRPMPATAHALPGDVGTALKEATWLNLMPREIVARAALNEGCRDKTANDIRSGMHGDVKIRAEVAVKLIGRIQEECFAALTPSALPSKAPEIGSHIRDDGVVILGNQGLVATETTAPEALSGEQCRRCGHDNRPWSAPSPLWNAVMRGGSIDGEPIYDDMVCAACFIQLATEDGIATGWTVKADKVNVPLETTTPSGRVWDDGKGLWVSALSGDAGEGERLEHARAALQRVRDRFTSIGNSSPLWCDMAEDMDAYAAEGLDRSKARG